MIYKNHDKIKAIIIDDDFDFYDQLNRILVRIDIDLILAKNSEEYFKLLEEVSPKFCLIDIYIGDWSLGFQIIKETVEKTNFQTPVIAISSQDQPQSVSHALELGACAYLAKPITPEEIKDLLLFHLKSEFPIDHKINYQTPRVVPIQININFETVINYIDEMGISFNSKHLIPKGNLIKLNNPAFIEIAGTESLTVSIKTNSLNSTISEFNYYAEFENLSADSLSKIRNWLVHAIANNGQKVA